MSFCEGGEGGEEGGGGEEWGGGGGKNYNVAKTITILFQSHNVYTRYRVSF